MKVTSSNLYIRRDECCCLVSDYCTPADLQKDHKRTKRPWYQYRKIWPDRFPEWEPAGGSNRETILHRKDRIHAPRNMLNQPLLMIHVSIAVRRLCNSVASLVPHFTQGSHNLRPVVIPIQVIDIKASIGPFLIPFCKIEFINVTHHNSGADCANPVLWPSVVHDISNIKVPSHFIRFKFIHVSGSLHRA